MGPGVAGVVPAAALHEIGSSTAFVEVEYRQRLKNGLRHAALKGLRPEKKPRLIRRSPFRDRGAFCCFCYGF